MAPHPRHRACEKPSGNFSPRAQDDVPPLRATGLRILSRSRYANSCSSLDSLRENSVPLSYDVQQQDFISSVTDALKRNCPLSLVREIGAGQPDRWLEIWEHITAMGLPSLLIPESAGGLELNAADMVAVLEAAGHFALPAPLATTIGGFVPLVVEADDGGAARLLREVVGGAAATLAPTVGADWTTPDAVVEGDLLTVHCDGIPEPGRAGLIAIPATRIDDGRVVLVVASTAQLDLTAEEAMDPTSPVGSLDLERHALGDAVVLDRDPRPALPVVWTAASAELVGLAAELVSRAAAFARDRVQFDKPIGSFQSIKHMIVDSHLAVERARSLTVYAALLSDQKDPKATAAAHNAKAAASEAGSAAARAAVQVHGGSGITKEEDVSLLYLRARQLSQLLGDAGFHYSCVSATGVDA